MQQPTRQFAFRLCLALGTVHPDVILRQLSSHQIAEWMAYFRLYPFGQDYTDHLIAQLTAEFANRWRGKTESVRQTSEFLPLYKRPDMSPDDIKLTLRKMLSGGRRKNA